MHRAALTIAFVLAFAAVPARPIPTGAQVGTPGAAATAGPVEFVWSTRGGPDLPLDMPAVLAIDPQGNLWVTDGDNSRFQRFAPDGTFLEAWGIPGSGDGQFDFVRAGGAGLGGVAFDAAGHAYVVDTGNFRVQRFAPDRRFVTAWGSEGDGDGQFIDPIGIAAGPDGRVYVIDDWRNDVQVFTADGAFLFKFGGPGIGDGKILDAGSGLAVAPDGTILVADYGNHRIQRFAPDGTFLAKWGEPGTGPGQLSNPDGLAVDEQGRVFVVDYRNHRVQVFDGEGRFMAELGGPGIEAGQFTGPAGIALDGAGQVYVGEYDGDRVQVFRLLPPLAPEATPTP